MRVESKVVEVVVYDSREDEGGKTVRSQFQIETVLVCEVVGAFIW